MKRLFRFLFSSTSGLFLLVYSFQALASFTISPMNQEINPKQKSASYTLENLSNTKAAYKVTVLTRDLLEDGTEQRQETKELRVFPSQVILGPGQKKRIKALYLGTRQLKTEKSFRVIFKQMDLDVSENLNQGIQAKIEFVTALYVTPPKASPKIQVTVAEKGNDLELALHNQGNKHQILQNWKLRLFNDSGENQLYAGKLPDINLLSNSRIILRLKPGNSIKGITRAEILSQ